VRGAGCERPGSALGEPVEILEVDELAPPSEDEVLIDVASAGIANWDELVRIGSWRIGGPAPVALGTEAAGPARPARRGSRRRVIATASAKKAVRIRGYGASEVLDCLRSFARSPAAVPTGPSTLPTGRRPSC
jgi:hypothetical protein